MLFFFNISILLVISSFLNTVNVLIFVFSLIVVFLILLYKYWISVLYLIVDFENVYTKYIFRTYCSVKTVYVKKLYPCGFFHFFFPTIFNILYLYIIIPLISHLFVLMTYNNEIPSQNAYWVRKKEGSQRLMV